MSKSFAHLGKIAVVVLTAAGVFGQDAQSGPSLSDAHASMKQAQQRLAVGDTSPETQKHQEAAASALAALIKAAKARESSSQKSSGGGQSQQQSPPSQSASQSQPQSTPGDNPGGGSNRSESAAAPRMERPAPQSPWSNLRDRERDPVYSAIKERFPARYQQLLEQYYKSFQESPRR